MQETKHLAGCKDRGGVHCPDTGWAIEWRYSVLLVLASIMAVTSLAPEVAEARPASVFLPAATEASIPVPPNGLGDVVQDTILDLRDLVRLRDLIHGLAGPPTPTELVQGDLNVDGELSPEDLEILGGVLLQARGVPQYLDGSDGGNIASEHVSMTFSSRDLGGPVVMGIEKVTAEQIRGRVGVDFGVLASDSTYYITAYELATSREDFTYPPAMDVAVDEMPPCELNGANLLMTARQGPLGDTELVMMTELTVTEDSVLVSPPPPYPAIAAPAGNAYEPFQILRLPVENISFSTGGNAVVFSQDGVGWLANTAAWFEPVDFATYDDVREIAVAVPDLPPGPTTVTLLHLGTGLVSEPRTINIVPCHVPAGDPAVGIIEAFAAIDTLLAVYPGYSLFQQYPFTENAVWRNGVPLLRPAFANMRDFILAQTVDVQQEALAWIENLSVTARVDSALAVYDQEDRDSAFTLVRALRVIIDLGDLGANARDPGSARANATTGTTGLAGYPSPTRNCDLPGEVGDATDIGDFEPVIKRLTYGATASQRSSAPFWSNGRLATLGLPAPVDKAVDPSFTPHRYPGVCMNIWRHNTNTRGHVGPPPDCGESAMSAPVSSAVLPGVKSVALGDVAAALRSPLMGAIVRPVNGGTPGIVGIVDGAGSFAIPGLTPGETIHFSIYDPNTGLFDPDAGYATAPDIAEQGVWFPSSLQFAPDETAQVLPIAFGEQVDGSIGASMQRVEYRWERDERDPGLVSLGFDADAPMKLEVTAPDGTTIVDLHNNASYTQVHMLFDQKGTYSFVVAFGTSVSPGSYSMRIWRFNYYPLMEIGQEAFGALHDDVSPYPVAPNAQIPVGRELTGGPGQTIEFEEGSRLVVQGALRCLGGSGAPFILRPTASTNVEKGMTTSARGTRGTRNE